MSSRYLCPECGLPHLRGECHAVKPRPRDFSPLYERGQCLICGVQIPWVGEAGVGPFSPEGHASPHLADGSAVVQLRYDRRPPTEQVVPTDSLPVTADIWENDHDSFTHKDTNSDLHRRALLELAATRSQVARELAKVRRIAKETM